MPIVSVALSTSPADIIKTSNRTRKLVVCNPVVNAAVIAISLDPLDSTPLTFANGIQLAAGQVLVIDIAPGIECPLRLQAIASAATPQINVQTLPA